MVRDFRVWQGLLVSPIISSGLGRARHGVVGSGMLEWIRVGFERV